MGDAAFQEALKLGKKEYKACVASGRFPYLPVLDDILSREEIRTEQNMGQIQIPLDFVVGTSTMGRTYSFAANFMPILGEGTEFGVKWANLAEAQVDEGIRDPIVAYEFMNRYYVVEGNKRVSVLKYFKADSIQAKVTRKIPELSDEVHIKLYYEYMKFNELTGVNSIEFSKLGMADTLLKLTGTKKRWDDEERLDFNSLINHFSKAYEFRGGPRLPITVGDALTAFIEVYGFEKVLAMSDADISANIVKCWNEFIVLTDDKRVDLVMDPDGAQQQKKNLLSYLLPIASNKKFTVAFLYPKSPESSDWIYGHDLGRLHLEDSFQKQIRTICVNDVTEDRAEEALEDVIKQGADIVFEVAPQMMSPTLKVAVDNPDVKILNCSLNTPHKYIRTYYARMYEGKFLSGIIAGAMTENDRIGYVADYPIYGMIANINAFALGATLTNPRAKIYLAWSTKKDYDRSRFLEENDIHIVSDQDMITPEDEDRMFGLYRYEDGKAQNLLMPLWNWGVFYEKMIRSMLTGSYQNEGSANTQALNYWWGMSAGVIDVICDKSVPRGVKRLSDHMKRDIRTGKMVPFYGEMYSQDGTLCNAKNQEMSAEDIMEMDYLLENVIGEIPKMSALQDAAKSVVKLKGVEDKK